MSVSISVCLCVCLSPSVCLRVSLSRCLSPERAAVVSSLVSGRWQQHQCVSVLDQRAAAEDDSVGMCPIRRDNQRQTVSDGSAVKGDGCIGSDKHAGHTAVSETTPNIPKISSPRQLLLTVPLQMFLALQLGSRRT